ncbi:MAG TPA: MBL fold metallo-hydrolase [Trueperaceae bacterium]|nr:MBL fold metallo-hydrolase [Trueperaceae bacterium]
MHVAEGVEALELTMAFMGGHTTIHPTLVWDESDVILIDAGMPGSLDAIREGARRAGAPFERLNRVILTHQDIDHIGGLPELLRAAGHDVEVLAHEADRPYIEGEKQPIKLNREFMAERAKDLPAEQRARVAAILDDPPRARVTRALRGGEKLPYCGGIRVFHTPGHTPGHISLYLNRTKTLVTGDALVSENGVLQGPRPGATPDMDSAVASLAKLTGLDIDAAVTYHGGVVTGDVGERLAELAGAG